MVGQNCNRRLGCSVDEDALVMVLRELVDDDAAGRKRGDPCNGKP